MLEASQYADNAFITLTYSDSHLPVSGSLIPEHLTNWLKRFRKQISPARVRYYAVGEYGDRSDRPHYHVAMFGFPNCGRGQSRAGLWPPVVNETNKCCVSCDLIASTWGLGSIYVGALETKSAQYVAGYVLKKMTNRQDPRLAGREPEFARMSRRPGLGVNALYDVADVLLKFNLEISQADVPSVLTHGKKNLPLGNFMRRKLRTFTGKDEHAPPEVLEEINREVRDLLQASIADPEAPSLKAMINKRDKGKIASVHARSSIFNKRKSL